MRQTAYWELMNDEFGTIRAASLHTDLALSTLDSRTPAEAFASGVDAREVWRAVCLAAGVPEERWLGIDRKPRTNPF